MHSDSDQAFICLSRSGNDRLSNKKKRARSSFQFFYWKSSVCDTEVDSWFSTHLIYAGTRRWRTSDESSGQDCHVRHTWLRKGCSQVKRSKWGGVIEPMSPEPCYAIVSSNVVDRCWIPLLLQLLRRGASSNSLGVRARPRSIRKFSPTLFFVRPMASQFGHVKIRDSTRSSSPLHNLVAVLHICACCKPEHALQLWDEPTVHVIFLKLSFR